MSLTKTVAKLILGRGVNHSYSQFGEDMVINAMFRSRQPGIYVDVGAYHPILYSTTFALYRRGWQGIVVDPNKDMRRLFGFMRPRDIFVNTAVGVNGSAIYYSYEDGSYNSLNEEHVNELKEKKGIIPKESYTVSVRTLANIVHETNIDHIEYLNVDAEGMDLKILETHDWNIRPRVITVEDELFDADTPDKSEMYTYLKSKDYALRGFAGLTLVFRDKRFEAAKVEKQT